VTIGAAAPGRIHCWKSVNALDGYVCHWDKVDKCCALCETSFTIPACNRNGWTAESAHPAYGTDTTGRVVTFSTSSRTPSSLTRIPPDSSASLQLVLLSLR
jgi:hypothetical protein